MVFRWFVNRASRNPPQRCFANQYNLRQDRFAMRRCSEEAERKNRDRQFRKREGSRWREIGGRPPRHAAICILTCTAIIATFAKRRSSSKQASMMRCGPLAAFASAVRHSMFYTGFRHNLSVFSRKNPVVRRLSFGRMGMHKSIDLGSSQDRFFGHHADHDLCFNGEVSGNPTATRTRPR